jgi:hypothetical protein
MNSGAKRSNTLVEAKRLGDEQNLLNRSLSPVQRAGHRVFSLVQELKEANRKNRRSDFVRLPKCANYISHPRGEKCDVGVIFGRDQRTCQAAFANSEHHRSARLEIEAGKTLPLTRRFVVG